MRLVAYLFTLALLLLAATVLPAQDLQIGRPLGKSLVPPWDLRGPLALPWQGITCADMTPDGRFVVLGTLAPYQDPNVFLLDENGKILEQRAFGIRWVNEVAVGPAGAWWAALTGFPRGDAGDRPELQVWSAGKEVSVPGDIAALLLRFNYGDHANCLTRLLQPAGDRLALVSAGSNGLSWLAPTDPQRTQASNLASMGVYPVTASAASPAGRAIVGRVISPQQRTDRSRDLVLLEAGATEPLWGRVPTEDVAPAPALEPGLFGPPTPPFTDVKVHAPLAVAVNAAGDRFASADYQGWDRYFPLRSDHALRFVPSHPTVQVYDAAGTVLRRFGPESFREPFWCDLAFLPDSDLLLAYPRSWTSRGLAGLGFLPADEAARTLYVLAVGSGQVRTVSFPDTIASVAVSRDLTAVACWDRRVYFLDHDLRPVTSLQAGVEVGPAALVRVSQDGQRVLAAGADGVVRMLGPQGQELWRTDLNRAAQPGEKPRLAQQKSGEFAPGLWTRSGGFTQSDMGNQWIIQAPQGLLLIDPNAGAALEFNWAGMKAAGLDPMQVKYVLLTHEHGDHSPAAYLWRVLTGAQIVASPEMAHMLRYRNQVSGYGFHPPQPVDVLVDQDKTLGLAGLQVTCVRTPGHTYGSMSYVFDLGDRRYCALGDLIMPGGAPGYWGSLDFSAAHILSSLRKLDALKPAVILGGHGQGDPADFLGIGIAAGEATGWGRMKPEKPNPLFGFKQKNYLVAAWGEPITAAAWGDVDGDGRPDVVVATRDEQRVAALKVFLNQGGQFAAEPDLVLPLAESVSWVRLLRLNEGKVADLYVASEGNAGVFRAQGDRLDYRLVPLPGCTRANQVLVDDFNDDGRRDLLLGGRFVGEAYWLYLQQEDGAFRLVYGKGLTPGYFDLALVDANGDGKHDLLTSRGDILLRQADGTLPAAPSLRLTPPAPSWTFVGVGDFNGDTRPDIALVGAGDPGGYSKSNLWVYYHTGDAQQPYPAAPSAKLALPQPLVLWAGPAVSDWNGDGFADLVFFTQNPTEAVILLGDKQGLSAERVVTLPLDYTPHHDTRLGPLDYDGDGKPDLAGWGPSAVRAQGVYILLQR